MSILLLIQSLVYCLLSSTKTIILFFQVICLLGLIMTQPLLSCSRVVIIGTLMKTHSVHDDPAPWPDPWEGACGVFWWWHEAIHNAVWTLYLMLWRVVELILQTWSGISNRRLWRVEWLFTIRSKQDFALFWRINKFWKVSRWVSVMNSLISATKSSLPPGTPPH